MFPVNPDCPSGVHYYPKDNGMPMHDTDRMRSAHCLLQELIYDPVELHRGYAGRWLRIDLGRNEITLHPVTEQMKELWTGGKGFDLWITLQEISADTKWDSPENPICLCSGPLGGTTSFPGSGKTLVTAISPLTDIVIDCNVGRLFRSFPEIRRFRRAGHRRQGVAGDHRRHRRGRPPDHDRGSPARERRLARPGRGADQDVRRG